MGQEAQPIPTFNIYKNLQIDRLERLAVTLRKGLSRVSDLNSCNQRLIAANRADLVIKERAQMKVLPNVEDFPEGADNFTQGFEVFRGDFENPTTITLEEIQKLREGGSAKEIFGRWNVVGKVIEKPACQRMLILFPDFMNSFITGISQPPMGRGYDLFRSEAYVAYQLMSQLVDVNDPHVLRNGEVDDWYLCR